MKKLLLSLVLSLSSLVTWGQEFSSQDLLNVQALATGTNGLGSLGITNLTIATGVTNVGMVHAAYIAYTNNNAVARATGVTNSVGTQRLFKTANFWTDRNGQPITLAVGGVVDGINIGGQSASNFTTISSQTLLIEVANVSVAPSNGPIGIVMTPVWSKELTEVTAGRAQDWTVIIPGLASGKYTMVTNVPTWRWPGAYGLTVRYITNENNNVTATSSTNCPWLTKLRLVGYRP